MFGISSKKGLVFFASILNCNITKIVALFQMFYSMTTIVSKPSVLSNPIFNIPKEGRVPNKLSSKFLIFYAMRKPPNKLTV